MEEIDEFVFGHFLRTKPHYIATGDGIQFDFEGSIAMYDNDCLNECLKRLNTPQRTPVVTTCLPDNDIDFIDKTNLYYQKYFK
jgi:hypothetical protein